MGIVRDVEENKPEVIRLRRRLHTDAETAFQEKTTARFIMRALQQAGLECHSVAGTGVIGILHGRGGAAASDTNEGGKRILLHATIDALPQEEKAEGRPYSSTNKSAHHGAGHDGDTAMLLTAAKHLAGKTPADRTFVGTVYFLFQPAGESLEGALKTLDNNFFERFPCDAVYSLTHTPDLPLGTIRTREGDMRPSSEDVIVQLISEGEGANTVKVAAAMAAAFDQINTQEFGTTQENGFLQVWNMTTTQPVPGEKPKEITLTASLRTFDAAKDAAVRKALEEKLDALANDNPTVGVYLDFKNPCPVLHNDAIATQFAKAAAADVSGTAETAPANLQPEGFAFFQQAVPGNLSVLGTGGANPAERTPLRSNKYDFNDAALPFGVSYWIRLVEKFFSVPSSQVKPSAPQQRF